MLMSALIFKLALITAVQPFLYVSRPLHPMATTAQRKLNQAGAPNQYKPSATTAKIPATTSGHQRVDVLSATSRWDHSPWSLGSSGVNPMARNAAKTVSNPPC